MNSLEKKLSGLHGKIRLKAFMLWLMLPVCLLSAVMTLPMFRFMDEMSSFSSSIQTRIIPQIVNTQATFVNLESLNRSLNVIRYSNDTFRVRNSYIDAWSVLMESLYDRPEKTQKLIYLLADELDTWWAIRQQMDQVRRAIFEDWQLLYTQGVSLHVLNGEQHIDREHSYLLSFETLGHFSLLEHNIREASSAYFDEHLATCRRLDPKLVGDRCNEMQETKMGIDEHFKRLSVLSKHFERQGVVVDNHMLTLTEEFSSLEIRQSLETVSEVSELSTWAKHGVLFYAAVFFAFILLSGILIYFVLLPLTRLSKIGRDFRVQMKRPERLPQSIVYEIQEVVRLMPLLFNDIEEKHRQSQVLAQENEGLSNQTKLDALTGVGNRRVLEGYQNRQIKKGTAVLMCDLDHFKRINDTKGHPFGDQVLQTIAKLLRDHLDRHDLLCRYGGEEFCVVLNDVTQQEAQKVGQRLVDLVRNSPIIDGQGASVMLTVSIGTSQVCGFDGEWTIDELIDQADRALYDAKSSGRDRVCC